MAASLIAAFKGPVKSPHQIESVELVPSGGGVYNVEVDGGLLFSKHQVGRHAVESEIVEAIRKRLSSML